MSRRVSGPPPRPLCMCVMVRGCALAIPRYIVLNTHTSPLPQPPYHPKGGRIGTCALRCSVNVLEELSCLPPRGPAGDADVDPMLVEAGPKSAGMFHTVAGSQPSLAKSGPTPVKVGPGWADSGPDSVDDALWPTYPGLAPVRQASNNSHEKPVSD